MEADYLKSVKQQFLKYKKIGEKAIEQIPDDRLSWQFNSESNSVGTIVKHLWGNMLSRWTDFLTTDGEKDWRERDAEFENDITSRAALMQKWNEGWERCFNALDDLQPADVPRTVFVRKQPMTVLDAIHKQLAHYAYHVGQIVYVAKMTTPGEWRSLSIPRNKSKDFNREALSKTRHQ